MQDFNYLFNSNTLRIFASINKEEDYRFLFYDIVTTLRGYTFAVTIASPVYTESQSSVNFPTHHNNIDVNVLNRDPHCIYSLAA